MALFAVLLIGCATSSPARLQAEPGAECGQQPHRFAEWFPIHHLKMPLLKSVADNPAAIEQQLAYRRCRAGAVLHTLGEPPLAEGRPSEVLRVIWMPSLMEPVVIRLERHSDGRPIALIKRRSGESPSGYRTEQKEVSEADFAAALAATERAGCWTAEHTCSAEVGIDPAVVWVDGETWLLEGARGDVHWGVEVHEPPDGPFRDAVRAVVRAAGGRGPK